MGVMGVPEDAAGEGEEVAAEGGDVAAVDVVVVVGAVGAV
jgi:hypothetical protein